MTKFNPPKFNEQRAKEVEAKLKSDFPENKWSEGYLVDIIRLSCKGNDYFFGHHGAFDLYLKKFDLVRCYCENCDQLIFITEYDDHFCDEICQDDYFGAQ